jgi:glycosyltransferase involved in cell wall biosynthesis
MLGPEAGKSCSHDAVATVEALVEAGYSVVLGTVEPTDWRLVEAAWSPVPRPHRELVLLPFKARMFGLYMRLLTSAHVLELRRECNLIVNTHGDLLPVNADVTYMHFPTFLVWRRSFSKYSTGFWRVYSTPYYRIQEKLAARKPRGILITNSRFSRIIIERYVGARPLVIYPPVDVKRFLHIRGHRRDSVVSLGRFSPEKRGMGVQRSCWMKV